MAQFWIRLLLFDNGRDINLILGNDHLINLSDIITANPTQEKYLLKGSLDLGVLFGHDIISFVLGPSGWGVIICHPLAS